MYAAVVLALPTIDLVIPILIHGIDGSAGEIHHRLGMSLVTRGLVLISFIEVDLLYLGKLLVCACVYIAHLRFPEE